MGVGAYNAAYSLQKIGGDHDTMTGKVLKDMSGHVLVQAVLKDDHKLGSLKKKNLFLIFLQVWCPGS